MRAHLSLMRSGSYPYTHADKSKLSLNYTCSITLNLDLELVYFALSLFFGKRSHRHRNSCSYPPRFCGIRRDNRLRPSFRASLLWASDTPSAAHSAHRGSGRDVVLWCYVHFSIHPDGVSGIRKGAISVIVFCLICSWYLLVIIGWSKNDPRTVS